MARFRNYSWSILLSFASTPASAGRSISHHRPGLGSYR
jgi:hypothetical protein